MAVIGAGAAGLVTAISAGRISQTKRAPLDIVLLDSRPRIGAKILMSGGTRCNVTNQDVKASDFQGGPSHFIKHVFKAFPPKETIRFFKEIKVELVLESSGKFFPVTHSARTVLDALIKETGRTGVELKTGIKITEVEQEGDRFHLKNAEGNRILSTGKIVLATGGLSYPTTGSDGTGYKIAKSFGHTLVGTFPALTPLLTDDSDWKDLSGVSLVARLSLFKNGRKACEYRDSFLFTHFGFSGPAALDISRHLASAGKKENPEIRASFLPGENEETLKALFQSAKKISPKKLVKNFLTEEFSLPVRFLETFLKKIGLSETQSIENFSNENQKLLIRSLLHYPLEATSVFGYRKAEVTAGGVDLKEVKAATLESKLVNGLYFAGEILDVDGRIGGFNFQWAWSTGALAGRSAARSFLP